MGTEQLIIMAVILAVVLGLLWGFILTKVFFQSRLRREIKSYRAEKEKEFAKYKREFLYEHAPHLIPGPHLSPGQSISVMKGTACRPTTHIEPYWMGDKPTALGAVESLYDKMRDTPPNNSALTESLAMQRMEESRKTETSWIYDWIEKMRQEEILKASQIMKEKANSDYPKMGRIEGEIPSGMAFRKPSTARGTKDGTITIDDDLTPPPPPPPPPKRLIKENVEFPKIMKKRMRKKK